MLKEIYECLFCGKNISKKEYMQSFKKCGIHLCETCYIENYKKENCNGKNIGAKKDFEIN